MRNFVLGLGFALWLSGNLSCDRASDSSTATLVGADEAAQLVLELEPVKKWRAHLTSVSQGKVQPVAHFESSPEENDGSWQLYLGESHQRHMVVWNRFRIHAQSGDVTVEDVTHNRYVPADVWEGHFQEDF